MSLQAPALSDRDLVARCAVRDDTSLAALSELYDQHQQAAYAFAHRLQADSERADELVAAAFLTLWERAHRYDPTHLPVQAWLLGLVRYHARTACSPLLAFPGVANSAANDMDMDMADVATGD